MLIGIVIVHYGEPSVCVALWCSIVWCVLVFTLFRPTAVLYIYLSVPDLVFCCFLLLYALIQLVSLIFCLTSSVSHPPAPPPQVSSRSHTIFTMIVERSSTDEFPTNTVARLTCVDLAGSERASKTKPTGVQLQEAKSINQSLYVLRYTAQCSVSVLAAVLA